MSYITPLTTTLTYHTQSRWVVQPPLLSPSYSHSYISMWIVLTTHLHYYSHTQLHIYYNIKLLIFNIYNMSYITPITTPLTSYAKSKWGVQPHLFSPSYLYSYISISIVLTTHLHYYPTQNYTFIIVLSYFSTTSFQCILIIKQWK